MGYTTSHDAHDFFCAAAMLCCHQVNLRCQRRATKHQLNLLKSLREIDLCSIMTKSLGETAHLAAQGTDDIDIMMSSPVLRAEVKYLRPGPQLWSEVKKDWDWLLSLNNTNGEFRKNAFVIFWPGTHLYDFTKCVCMPKCSTANTYGRARFAPFVPYADPVKKKKIYHLSFRNPIGRSWQISLPKGKAVKAALVGDLDHFMWAVVYTRTTIPRFTSDDVNAGKYAIT